LACVPIDIALEVVNQFPEVALHREDYGIYALQALAKKHLKSHSTPRWSWTKWISKCLKIIGGIEKEFFGLKLVI